jgi:hypothetical protein
VHHLDPRAEGGTHAPDRLATLCGAHHRAIHHGTLHVDGTGSTGFAFHHADGTPYGKALSGVATDVAAQALRALENMGFRATEARLLVAAAREAGAPADDLGRFLEAALRAS